METIAHILEIFCNVLLHLWWCLANWKPYYGNITYDCAYIS